MPTAAGRGLAACFARDCTARTGSALAGSPRAGSALTGSARFRHALAGAAGVLAFLLTPGVAVAEGAGYGGGADALTVQWQDGGTGDGATDEGALAVYAVGFRGGSTVTLRLGAATERTVAADPVGALRVLIVGAPTATGADPALGTTLLTVDASTVDGLSPGATVQATGESPSNTVRTLLGAVPQPVARAGGGLVLWGGAAAALAVLGGLSRHARPLLRRVRRNGG